MSLVADVTDDLDHSGAAVASARAPIALERIPGEEWDRTVGAFDEVCQEQLYAFAKSRWPSVRNAGCPPRRDCSSFRSPRCTSSASTRMRCWTSTGG